MLNKKLVFTSHNEFPIPTITFSTPNSKMYKFICGTFVVAMLLTVEARPADDNEEPLQPITITELKPQEPVYIPHVVLKEKHLFKRAAEEDPRPKLTIMALKPIPEQEIPTVELKEKKSLRSRRAAEEDTRPKLTIMALKPIPEQEIPTVDLMERKSL
ncbi:hypothetical protein Ocin01_16172 [Orchesella cincta]|uniref:Uncharacterized protein n=1 Tax=Orchesella cincta TaxID=48709 RepID=A0A1D2MCA0_ORCCI|nr:hypothetical protein Ocin01_16172 [Orchesella cincta]